MTTELWITRDKNSELLLHDVEPINNGNGCWESSGNEYNIDWRLFPEVTYENSPQKVALNLLTKNNEYLEQVNHIGYQKLFNGFKVGDEVMTAKGSKGEKTTIEGFVKIATGNGKEEIKARTTHGWIAIDQLVKIK